MGRSFFRFGATFATLTLVGLAKKPGSVYKNEPSGQNPFEGKRVMFVEDPNEPLLSEFTHCPTETGYWALNNFPEY